jgi:ABC-type glutathione transport system ATPase component
MSLAPCCVGSGPCGHVVCARSITRRYAARDFENTRPGIAETSLSVARGERVAVIGRSGAGKSTLARCLALLDHTDAGEIWIDGVLSSAAVRPHLRRMVQLVFQDSEAAFNPRFTSVQAVEEPLRYGPPLTAPMRIARAHQLLDLMHVPRAVVDRRVRTLSGGERRRVLLARALATSPKALILDETFTAMDEALNTAVMRTLSDLQRAAGFAIVQIGHDLDAARRCDRVVVIDGGAIVESGAAVDVLAYPRSAAGRLFADADRRRRVSVPC